MAKLEIEIGADNSEFKLKVKEVEKDIKELSQVKLERIKLGLDTKEIDLNIKDAKASLKNLQTSLKDTGASFAGMSKPVKDGGNTLMQFSRIAQDAPFGIMGIGNNITATAESFSYLSKSSGGAGNALKAVASSMMGTGGILLAVSLVTTGLTIMSQKGITVGDVFNKLSGNFNQFAKEIETASNKAIESTTGEISSLKQLIFVAQNETISKKERLAAVKKLQDEYPGYFGNLSKEQILTSDLTTVTKELTKALINKAIAENLTEASVAPTLKLYHANALLLKQKEEQIQKQQELDQAVQSGASAQALAFYSNNLKKVDNKLKETRDIIVSSTKETQRLQDAINIIGASSSKLLIKPDAKQKNTKTKPTNVKGGVIGFTSELDSAGLESKVFDTGKIDEAGNKIKSAEAVITTSMGNIRTAIDVNLLASMELMRQFNNDVNSLINDSISGTFNNLGTAIGEAMANGTSVLGAIGTTLVQSLGSFLSDLGGMLIKYGMLAVAKGKLDLAILTGGPVSIGAGIAAIGVGILLKAAGSAIGKASSKGGSSSSVSTGSSYSSPSSVSYAGSSSSYGGGTVVFEISGTSLIGVLNNTTDRNLRLGGRN